MNLSFEDACGFLFARTGGATEWSLGPTQELLAELGAPHQHYRCVHIAGTNGKGSVAAFVASALAAGGSRVGLYTSPHLVSVRERMMVNGSPISEEAFAMWTARLAPRIEATGASFFEATTAIALADFAARHVDVAIIEVGLGGRLDATNVVDPLVCVVTTVGLEHTAYLGSTLSAIAREKAGIAKPGIPLVIGETAPSIVDVLTDAARRAGAIPIRVDAGVRYAGPLPTAGSLQRRNAAVAQEALRHLPEGLRPGAEVVQRGFCQVALPGRFERRGKWILDVAHNPAGIAALIGLLQEEAVTRPLHALMGVLADKDWPAMVETLLPCVDRLWVTTAPSAPEDRRWDPDSVAARFGDAVTAEPDFDRALAAVQQGAGSALVCGSFHTVGDAMVRLPGFAPLG